MADRKHSLASEGLTLGHIFKHLHAELDPCRQLFLSLHVVQPEPAVLCQDLTLFLTDAYLWYDFFDLCACQAGERLAAHVDTKFLMDLSHDFTWCCFCVYVSLADILE